MDKRGMLDAMIAHYTGGNKAKFAILLGVSAQTISAWGTRNTFDSELIYTKCIGISSDWLLTGEGSMLRDSKIPEEATMDHGTEKVQSASSEAIALRMMDKLDEKDNIIKEKDVKIDHLQSELLSAKEEIATLKAKYQDKESGFKFPDISEAFTSESSGDYGEGYSSTRKPTTSARSSAAKT